MKLDDAYIRVIIVLFSLLLNLFGIFYNIKLKKIMLKKNTAGEEERLLPYLHFKDMSVLGYFRETKPEDY